MGFLRQKYWSGLPYPTPGALPSPGIEPVSPALAGRFFTAELPGKPQTKALCNSKGISRASWDGYPNNNNNNNDNNLPAVPDPWVPSLGWEDTLRKGTITHWSFLACRIPWTEEPGGLSPKCHKYLDTTEAT